MVQFHKLCVQSIDRETPEAVSIGFEVPPALTNDFQFVAGQYLTLEKEIAGKSFRRSYSICSSPQSGKLKIAVKEVTKGLFSAWINKKLAVGDTLNVCIPQGRFTYKPPADKTPKVYLAFAAGSGITPIMAILQNVLEAEPSSKFILVYGNKTPEQTIFYHNLLALKEKYTDRLFIEFVYSQIKSKPTRRLFKNRVFSKKKTTKEEKIEPKPLFGRIEQKTVSYIIKEKYKHLHFAAIFLCGPQPMIEMASTVLQKNGIAKEDIHYELFKTEKTTLHTSKETSGKTQVTVILDEEETTFEMDRNERILDAIMREGLDPPYSCQGGTCSSCLAQITQGEAEMANNQVLTEGETEDGLILTCQAHPTTATLVVDYDTI